MMETVFPDAYGGDASKRRWGKPKEWLYVTLVIFVLALTITVLINARISYGMYEERCAHGKNEKFIQYLGATANSLRTDQDNAPDTLQNIARANNDRITSIPVGGVKTVPTTAAVAEKRQTFTDPELEIMRKQRDGVPV